MVCGDFKICQCYRGACQDYVCWKDERGNVRVQTAPIPDNAMEMLEGETEIECIVRYRRYKIQEILESLN